MLIPEYTIRPEPDGNIVRISGQTYWITLLHYINNQYGASEFLATSNEVREKLLFLKTKYWATFAHALAMSGEMKEHF